MIQAESIDEKMLEFDDLGAHQVPSQVLCRWKRDLRNRERGNYANRVYVRRWG